MEESLKELKTVCKDKCMSTLLGHSAFLIDLEVRRKAPIKRES